MESGVHMSEKDSNKLNEEEEIIELQEELDEEALSVIFRLYDKTFKDLADR